MVFLDEGILLDKLAALPARSAAFPRREQTATDLVVSIRAEPFELSAQYLRLVVRTVPVRIELRHVEYDPMCRFRTACRFHQIGCSDDGASWLVGPWPRPVVRVAAHSDAACRWVTTVHATSLDPRESAHRDTVSTTCSTTARALASAGACDV